MAESTQCEDGDASNGSPFPRPPRTITDKAGRTIDIRVYEDDREALVNLYESFDREDRTQGLPPPTSDGIQTWLDDIAGEGLHLVAWHRESAVGHACLLPSGDIGHELAIFVRSAYQRTGIGTHLLRTLLGYGKEQGVERVWLTVHRDNLIARNLYDSAGFECVTDRTGTLASDVKMARNL